MRRTRAGSHASGRAQPWHARLTLVRRGATALVYLAVLVLGLFGLVFSFLNYPWLEAALLLVLLAVIAGSAESRRRSRRRERERRRRRGPPAS